jgi:hypothetical protein
MNGFLRLSVVRVGDVRSHEVARLSLQQRFARDPLFTNEGIESSVTSRFGFLSIAKRADYGRSTNSVA